MWISNRTSSRQRNCRDRIEAPTFPPRRDAWRDVGSGSVLPLCGEATMTSGQKPLPINRSQPSSLNGPLPPPLSRKDKWAQLVSEVSRRHDVDPTVLLARDRREFVVRARDELFYLARLRHGWSFTILGQLSGLNHSAPIHAIKRYCKANDIPLPSNMGSRIGTRTKQKTANLK